MKRVVQAAASEPSARAGHPACSGKRSEGAIMPGQTQRAIKKKELVGRVRVEQLQSKVTVGNESETATDQNNKSARASSKLPVQHSP